MHAGRRMGGYVMRGGGWGDMLCREEDGGICHAGIGGYVMRGGGWRDMSCGEEDGGICHAGRRMGGYVMRICGMCSLKPG